MQDPEGQGASATARLYDIPVRTLESEDTTLAPFQGQVLLIVNVASECGFTPQYAGLEALHQRFRERGFSVLGFPCNQFGGQEPGTAAEIGAFCERNFGVSFPLYEKVQVNGRRAHPLFQYLKRAQRGVLKSRAIKWNFTKFLVDRDGNVVRRFSSRTTPPQLEGPIADLLGS
ncbi:MAG: glutathione peroxidase [Gemmatimonadales bacterium]